MKKKTTEDRIKKFNGGITCFFDVFNSLGTYNKNEYIYNKKILFKYFKDN